MSRSKLKNKFMRGTHRSDKLNPHHLDEMTKNRPTKFITTRCEITKVRWIQEAGSLGGHKVKHQGHRMVSGIVRQKVKEEIRKEINDERTRKEEH